jgi:hypothetical protein
VSNDKDQLDGTPQWLRGDRPIQVDLATLEQFAKALQDEVDLNFKPHVQRIATALTDTGMPFQRKDDFRELTTTRDTYLDSRTRMIYQLVGFAEATAELAAAARLIAQHYGDSDTFAAAQVADVQQAIAEAAKPIDANGVS